MRAAALRRLGFHFKVRVERRVFGDPVERAERMVVGGRERWGGGHMERDMETVRRLDD